MEPLSKTLDIEDRTIPIQTEKQEPFAYRLRRDISGIYTLQGCYAWAEESDGPYPTKRYYEWRDIPTIWEEAEHE